MFKGFILSESLKNPTILNVLKKIYVKVEKHTESDIPFWHLFKIEIQEEKIESITKIISSEMKESWYAHFWNGQIVYIVFSNKVFEIPQERKWLSPRFQEAKQYGIEHGVEERYLDFWIEE